MLNWRIIGNPINWVIIWVVLLLGAYGAHLLGLRFEQQSTSST